MFEQILNQPVNLDHEISEDAKDLLQKLLNKDQSKRPTISEVMQHPWFNGHTSMIAPI